MDAVIRGNTFIYNGEGGLSGYKSDRTIIEGNYIGYNNTEHFKAGWDANGAKHGARGRQCHGRGRGGGHGEI
jgi:parallel beta-helix repeat protein